jgi:hypothetical protein
MVLFSNSYNIPDGGQIQYGLQARMLTPYGKRITLRCERVRRGPHQSTSNLLKIVYGLVQIKVHNFNIHNS